MTLSPEPVTRERKFTWILILLGASLLLAGSVYAADWMNFTYQSGALYPAVAKPCIRKKKRRGSAMRSIQRVPTSSPAASPSKKTVRTSEKL